VREYGSFLTERRVGGDRMYHFAIDDFYVEVFHRLSSVGDGRVSIRKVFRKGVCFNEYLFVDPGGKDYLLRTKM